MFQMDEKIICGINDGDKRSCYLRESTKGIWY